MTILHSLSKADPVQIADLIDEAQEVRSETRRLILDPVTLNSTVFRFFEDWHTILALAKNRFAIFKSLCIFFFTCLSHNTFPKKCPFFRATSWTNVGLTDRPLPKQTSQFAIPFV